MSRELTETIALVAKWVFTLVCSVAVVGCLDGDLTTEVPTSDAGRSAPPPEAPVFLTTCGPNEYESSAATTTSDRTCSPVTVCDSSEYEST